MLLLAAAGATLAAEVEATVEPDPADASTVDRRDIDLLSALSPASSATPLASSAEKRAT